MHGGYFPDSLTEPVKNLKTQIICKSDKPCHIMQKKKKFKCIYLLIVIPNTGDNHQIIDLNCLKLSYNIKLLA